MDFKFLSERIKYIILNPGRAWDAISSENRPIRYVKGSFFFPLIILVAISAFLGSILFVHTGISAIYSVMVGIKYFLVLYIAIYATSYIFKEITNYLKLGDDFTVAFKIITYSVSPFLICQILSRLFESFIFVNILSLFGLYIFWIGAEKMLNPPEDQKIPLLVSAVVVFIAVFLIGSWLLSQIIDGIYFAFFA